MLKRQHPDLQGLFAGAVVAVLVALVQKMHVDPPAVELLRRVVLGFALGLVSADCFSDSGRRSGERLHWVWAVQFVVLIFAAVQLALAPPGPVADEGFAVAFAVTLAFGVIAGLTGFIDRKLDDPPQAGWYAIFYHTGAPPAWRAWAAPVGVAVFIVLAVALVLREGSADVKGVAALAVPFAFFAPHRRRFDSPGFLTALALRAAAVAAALLAWLL